MFVIRARYFQMALGTLVVSDEGDFGADVSKRPCIEETRIFQVIGAGRLVTWRTVSSAPVDRGPKADSRECRNKNDSCHDGPRAKAPSFEKRSRRIPARLIQWLVHVVAHAPSYLKKEGTFAEVQPGNDADSTTLKMACKECDRKRDGERDRAERLTHPSFTFIIFSSLISSRSRQRSLLPV
jgi:hypothetical protein